MQRYQEKETPHTGYVCRKVLSQHAHDGCKVNTNSALVLLRESAVRAERGHSVLQGLPCT